MKLGPFIRTTRHEKGLTLRELARKAEISAPFLSDLERGNRSCSEAVLVRLARPLGVPATTLNDIRMGDRIAEADAKLRQLRKERKAS